MAGDNRDTTPSDALSVDGAATVRAATLDSANTIATAKTATASARPAARRGRSTPAPEDSALALEKVALFADLDAESMRELATVMKRRTFRPGEIIFHRDDPGQVLYVLRTGKVKIFMTSPDGQEVALAIFSPGDYFGELALLDGYPRSASAIALESAETFALQRPDFLKAVMRHPRIAIHVMHVLSERLRQTDEMVEDLVFRDVHGRVAKKLLDLVEQHGERTAEGIRIDMRLTQADLASMVGATRESINKVMGYFTDKHIVSTDRHRITVTHLSELRRRVSS